MAEILSGFGGLWRIISDTTLSVNQTFIDFLNLNLNGDGGYILAIQIYNNNAVNTDYNLFINGDSVDAHYYRQLNQGGVITSGNSGVFVTLPLNDFISLVFYILDNPQGNPLQQYTGSSAPAAKNAVTTITGSILCPAVANITSMRVNASNANALPAGSRFILSKMK